MKRWCDHLCLCQVNKKVSLAKHPCPSPTQSGQPLNLVQGLRRLVAHQLQAVRSSHRDSNRDRVLRADSLLPSVLSQEQPGRDQTQRGNSVRAGKRPGKEPAFGDGRVAKEAGQTKPDYGRKLQAFVAVYSRQD